MSLTSGIHRFTRRQFLQRSAALGAAIGLTSLAGCTAPVAPQTGTTGEAAPAAAGEEILFWKPPTAKEKQSFGRRSWKDLQKPIPELQLTTK